MLFVFKSWHSFTKYRNGSLLKIKTLVKMCEILISLALYSWFYFKPSGIVVPEFHGYKPTSADYISILSVNKTSDTGWIWSVIATFFSTFYCTTSFNSGWNKWDWSIIWLSEKLNWGHFMLTVWLKLFNNKLSLVFYLFKHGV